MKDKNKNRCPCCGSTYVKVVVSRGNMGVPVFIDETYITKCEICGVLFQPVDNNSVILRKHKIKRILNRTI